MQVQNVMGREFRKDVGSVFRAIGSEWFYVVTIGKDGRTELSFDLFTTNSPLGSFTEGRGRLEPDHGPIRGPRFADKHGRVDACPSQTVMQPIGCPRCAACDIVGTEMNDFRGSNSSAASKSDVVLLVAV
jgi:hypothetical protein